MLRCLLLTFLAITTLSQASSLKVSTSSGDQTAHFAIDGDWRTVWRSEKNDPAKEIIIDFKTQKKLYGMVYIPEAYRNIGRIRKYRISVSSNGRRWRKLEGEFNTNNSASYWPSKKESFDTVIFPKPTSCRYMKLTALSTVDDQPIMAIAELQPIFDKDKYPFKGLTMAHLKGYKMAPSIHLSYSTPSSQVFYNEMTIHESHDGSYFMALGFSGGYFGLQQLDHNKKRLLFSVWDIHKGHDQKAVPEEKRTKVIYKSDRMTVKRFGNEGTGGQSFCEYNWKIGQTYRFMVHYEHKDERDHYTAFFYLPEQKRWEKLLTFASLSNRGGLRGMNCFVEDFKRNFDSYNNARTASFGNSTFLDPKGHWQKVRRIRFTRDSNPNENVNCRLEGHKAYLTTGGKTVNKDIKVSEGTQFKKVTKEIPDDIKELF